MLKFKEENSKLPQDSPSSIYNIGQNGMSHNNNNNNNNEGIQTTKKCTIHYRTLALIFLRTFFATFIVGAIFTFTTTNFTWQNDMIYRVYKEFNVSIFFNVNNFNKLYRTFI